MPVNTGKTMVLDVLLPNLQPWRCNSSRHYDRTSAGQEELPPPVLTFPELDPPEESAATDADGKGAYDDDGPKVAGVFRRAEPRSVGGCDRAARSPGTSEKYSLPSLATAALELPAARA